MHGMILLPDHSVGRKPAKLQSCLCCLCFAVSRACEGGSGSDGRQAQAKSIRTSRLLEESRGLMNVYGDGQQKY